MPEEMDLALAAEMARLVDVLSGRTKFGRDYLCSTGDVAELLNVSEATIKRWADARRFPSIRTVGGHRKVRLEDVARFSLGGMPR